MRYIPLEKAKPGMKIAAEIVDEEGRVLIGVPSTLTVPYLARLQDYGFDGIYIEDGLSSDIEIEPPIPAKLRREGMDCVKRMDIDGCMSVARDIVREIIEKGNVSLDFADLRTFDSYTYSHSVNVAVLCCVLGMGYGMNEEELTNLVLAGLIHDIGKLSIPLAILNKPAQLTPEEFGIIRQHPMESYRMIQDRWDISTYTKIAVRGHHENEDGTGYPDGLIGDRQSIYTKMLHAADAYDALTSKRPYKKGYSSAEALEYLMGNCGRLYDTEVVSLMKNYVPQYPKGTEILLSDGRTAIVVRNSGSHNLRPVVRVIENGETIDLMDLTNLNLTIQNLNVDTQTVSEQFERNRSSAQAMGRYYTK